MSSWIVRGAVFSAGSPQRESEPSREAGSFIFSSSLFSFEPGELSARLSARMTARGQTSISQSSKARGPVNYYSAVVGGLNRSKEAGTALEGTPLKITPPPGDALS